jgi:hypothetical protein
MVQPALDIHEFHIPVMGTGFTIDSPLHVARYGISSVVSLVDDILIEQMREHYCRVYGRPYEAIAADAKDARAERIRAYLDLMADVVAEQFEALRQSPFEPGSEIMRYFTLLPESGLQQDYAVMMACSDDDEKAVRQERLRGLIQPGRIDVNIMTKVDRLPDDADGNPMDPQFSDTLSALRGFATSKVRGGMVFSAGLNAPLYTAVGQYDDFLPDAGGESRKTVILKVSDYRSAMIQGRFLAKRGVWVSEFRIESGLHCGGHAFATQGFLLGPILDEFQKHRESLQVNLYKDYCKALEAKGIACAEQPRRMAVTVQGGIATHAEHKSLLAHYGVDGTGWGTPFLLVPEATSLDEKDLRLLIASKDGDVLLSDSSPLGVPFWTLKTSTSECEKERRIAAGQPGSGCPKGYLKFTDELTRKPVCRASRQYQSLKLAALQRDQELPVAARDLLKEQVLAKACICHELGGGALLKHGIRKSAYSAICPSLSILHFKAVHSLEEMVGHIYGRWSLIKDQLRPHMFIREISIYIDYLHRELDRMTVLGDSRKPGYYAEFKANLLRGIEYYQQTFHEYVTEQQDRFAHELEQLRGQLEQLVVDAFVSAGKVSG